MKHEFKTLEVEVDDRGVAYVVLNLPEKRNAMAPEMLDDLTELAQGIGAAEQTRAIVLSGAGKVFCAGGDLGWMKAQFGADRATRIREARRLADMLQALNTMPTPLIAKVHGGAFGGGVGLACIADVVVAEENAKFGLTETRLGLIPATISAYVVARLGEGKTRQIFMSSRLFGAEESVHLGVVSKVASADNLDAAVEAEVAPYLSVAPGAVGRAKGLARRLGPVIDEETIAASIEELADCWESPEAAEGISAFLEKRKPNFAAKTGD